MIKFNCLIHKETGTVIKYEDWLKMYSCDNGMNLGKHSYHNEEMLFSDDFEIIYDSEFTVEELQKVLKDNLDNEILYKIVKNIDSKKFIKAKYGIEV